VRSENASLPRTDVHQHLWSEPLVAALGRRSETPRVRAIRGELRLELAGEPASALCMDDATDRAALTAADGLDRALVALSCPLGIESLELSEAEPLIGAYAEGVAALPQQFGAWGAIPLRDPDPRRVDALLDEGFAGVCLPAEAVGSPEALDRLGPLLERLEQRDAPLFVHPGPAARATAGAPAWWPALTDYVTTLAAAWLAWLAHGRPAHPRLRILFAALAGLAPLHSERLTGRGGPALKPDSLTFYDTSSYGPIALAAMAAAVGREQLVYGSDRPVVTPSTAAADDVAVHAPARLLG
jgi:predicted TIM-barrel fold metal-dependent hydrolase